MKTVIVFCVLSVVALTAARPEEQYTDRYDTVNLDEILANRRLLEPYVHCLLDKGKCTPEGTELKGHIKDALETECSKCTEAQKKGTRRVIGHLINNEAEFWEQLSTKYDPKKQYTTKYEKELREVKASAA